MKLSKASYQIGLIILFLFLPASLLYYGNPLDHMPGRDNGVFLYGGQQLLAGKTPYLDFWDHKGPLIYFIDALGLLIGKGSRWGVWIVEFTFLALTTVKIYQTARIQWSKTAGIVAVIYWAYTLGQVGHYKYFSDSNYTETYSLLFNIMAVYLWLQASKFKHPNWGYFAIGVSTGLSLLLRPNNIGIQISIVLVELIAAISKREIKDFAKKISFLALGVFSILAVFIAWFISRNALSALMDAVLNYNVYYAQKNQVKGFTTSYIELVSGGFNKLGWFPFIGYGILLLLWISRQLKQKTFNTSHDNIFILIILIGLPLETILSSISGRVFYHYIMIWTPYLALLAGALANEVFLQTAKAPPLNKISPAIVLTITLAYLFTVNIPVLEGYARLGNRFLFHNNESLEAQNAIVKYVNDVTQPGDTVLVWGNDVWINFLTDRASPAKYSYQFPLFMPGYTTEEKVLDFLAVLQFAPPVLIVESPTDTAEMLPLNTELRTAAGQAQVNMPEGMQQVFKFVDENYCIARKLNDTIVYRLKSNSGCE